MKDKNFVDPKMAVYCQAVRDLEDKFHRLKLHHVLRDYNKAANVLAKTASSRSPVPHGVFASNQHAPSICAKGEKPPEEEEPEVLAIDQLPKPNLEDPDWRFPFLEWLVEGKLPSDQTEARRIAPRTKAFVLIEGQLYKRGPMAYLCGASLETRAVSCYERYTPAPAVITSVREHLSERLSDKDSTGPRRWRTPRTSYHVVKGASSTLDKLTSRRRRSRPSPSCGLSPSGTSTWCGHSDKCPGASLTSS
jgi:hypothetical protein